MDKNKQKNQQIKPKKIKILAWMDSPACATGFATVSRNVLNYLAKTGRYEIEVIGINDTGGYKDTIKFPYKIWPARPNLDTSLMIDFHGRSRLLASVIGQDPEIKPPWDIVFTLNDPFILEEPLMAFNKGTMEVLKVAQLQYAKAVEVGKLPPQFMYKIISYWPIDSAVKENWIDSIAYPDKTVAYTEYGKREITRGNSYRKEPFADLPNRIKIIYHGVNLNQFKLLPKEEVKEFRAIYFDGKVKDETFLVTTVARNQMRKDLPRTLQVFSEFLKRRPQSFLYLNCKESDAWGSLKEHARNWPNLEYGENWGCPSAFSANQGIPVEALNMVYNSSDCILSTSQGEGFGFYNLEGFATKTIVIAPNNTCYSDDTVVFTPTGIKKHDEIKKGDLVWSFNLKTHNMEVKPIVKVVNYDYDGEMYHVKSKKVDLLVTPNHRILMKGRKKNLYEYKRADSLPSYFNLPVTAGWVGETPKETINVGNGNHFNANVIDNISIDNFLELAGWYLAEGCLESDKDSPQTTRVTIYEPEKSKYRKEIVTLLEKMGIKFFLTSKNDGLRFSNYGVFKMLSQFGEGAKFKKIPEWTLKLDTKHLGILFKSMMKGDGATADNINYMKEYTTVSKELAEGFAELSFKLGFNPKITYFKQNKTSFINGREIKGDGCYRVILRKTSGNIKKERGVSIEEYKGRVWCFTVKDNDNFLVGRNGKFVFCGNTHPELFGYDYKEDISDMDTLSGKVRGVPYKSGSTLSEWACYGTQDLERVRPLANIDDAVKKLIWVYDNPDKVKEIEERAYNWVQGYSWDIISKQWDELFQETYKELENEREQAVRKSKEPRPAVDPAEKATVSSSKSK